MAMFLLTLDRFSFESATLFIGVEPLPSRTSTGVSATRSAMNEAGAIEWMLQQTKLGIGGGAIRMDT